MKTRKSALKRFKVTGSGKLKHGRRNRRHLMRKKTKKLKRQARKGRILAKADTPRVKMMLGLR